VRAGEFGTADCFDRMRADNFEILDSRNLIVFAPGRADAYHVQVAGPATELRFASMIGFRSNGSRICGYAGDMLAVGGFGSAPELLPIMAVYRLDEVALAGLRGRFGRQPPRDKTEPQPGPGPALERELEGSPAAADSNEQTGKERQ
jgi:hypothetical protein